MVRLIREVNMEKKDQHVVPHGKNWAVEGEGNKRATRVTKTKKEAMQIARKIAKKAKSEVVVHKRNGKISDKDSYGNDPCPPKDKKH